jgi:hypothetical protein
VIPVQLFVASFLGWLQHEQHEIILQLAIVVAALWVRGARAGPALGDAQAARVAGGADPRRRTSRRRVPSDRSGAVRRRRGADVGRERSVGWFLGEGDDAFSQFSTRDFVCVRLKTFF